MMIDRTLQWRQFADQFDTAERKILLALSTKKWLWRTLDNLGRVIQLTQEDLDWRLADLIERGLVKGSVNRRTGEPIFGLSERVGGVSSSAANSSSGRRLRPFRRR